MNELGSNSELTFISKVPACSFPSVNYHRIYNYANTGSIYAQGAHTGPPVLMIRFKMNALEKGANSELHLGLRDLMKHCNPLH